MSLKIIVDSGYVPSSIFLYYDEEITYDRQRPLLEAIISAIAGLHGVEMVAPKRYSLEIQYASHVTTERELIDTLFTHVFDDPNVESELTAAYPLWLAEEAE